MRVTEFCHYSKTSLSQILADLRTPRTSPAMNAGTIWHSLILRTDRWGDVLPPNIAVLEFDNYTTKAAQTAKKEALEANKNPILKKDLDAINESLDFLKPEIDLIFNDDFAEFEKKLKGTIWGIDFVGHLDYLCVKNGIVKDLKISENVGDLDRLIFDFRYQMQMYLYMLLSDTKKAELVFLNPKSLLIQVKRLNFDELLTECEILSKIAIKNIKDAEVALNEPLALYSNYSPKTWALNELEKFLGID